jgi:hypothetical protein
MSGDSKGNLLALGAVVALLGVMAIAVPIFTTSETTNVANIGDVKLTTQEEVEHVIPRFTGPAALLIGFILIGAGLVARR